MYLLTTIALASGLALPQGPSKGLLDRHAAHLPADTVVALGLESRARLRDDFHITGLDRIVADPDGGPSSIVRAIVARWVGPDAPELPIVERLGELGLSLAITGDDADHRAHVVAILDAEATTTTALRTALDRRATAGTEVARLERNGTALYAATLQGEPCWIAVTDDTVVVGSAPEVVAAAARPDAAATLATSTRFQGARAPATGTGHLPVLRLFVDIDALRSTALRAAPADGAATATKILAKTGLDRLAALDVDIHVADGEVVESAFVTCPRPRSPLLDALFPAVSARAPELANAIPNDAAGYSIGQLDLRGFVAAALATLDSIDPEYGANARGLLAMATSHLGPIDLQKDVLAHLGTRIVSVQWANERDSSGDSLVLLQLDRPERITATLGKISALQASSLANTTMWISERDTLGAFAVIDDQLVVATTEKRLRKWVTSRKSPVPNVEIERLLTALPATANGFGVFDFQGIAARLPTELPPLPVDSALAIQSGALLRDVIANIGAVRWTSTVDDHGFGYRVQSMGGTLTRALVAAFTPLVADAATDPSIAAMVDRTDVVERTRDARVLTMLDAIRDAEFAFQTATGQYASLATLVETGRVDRQGFDEFDGAKARIDDIRFTVLLETDGATRFAVVAWPDEQRTGPVFACDVTRPVHRNELVANTRGITAPTTADVYVGGDFGASWTPGWRPTGNATRATSAVAKSRGANASTLNVIASLEQQGETGVSDLIGYLAHDDPVVVARAAWALGNVHSASAVPHLIDVLERSNDVDVRRHAMRALFLTKDPRSALASVRALGDDDAEVRCFAASNVGRLRHAEAGDALVGVLMHDSTDNDRDAVAALLALNDLADPKQLLSAATAFRRTTAAAQEALAFLFQNLSTQLPPREEAQLLMAVLDHDALLLRRYAIQRLGELADPLSTAALEARLTQEEPSLRPLLELALSAAHGASADGGSTTGTDFAARLEGWTNEAKRLWDDQDTRVLVITGGAFLVVVMLGLAILRRRMRRQREADSWAAMTRPSTGFTGRGRPRYEDYDPDGNDVDAAVEWAEDAVEVGAEDRD